MNTKMTKLARLNQLLEQNAEALNLQPYRSQVGASGANQDWLRKALKRHPEVDPEIVSLLSLPFKELLTEYVPEGETE